MAQSPSSLRELFGIEIPIVQAPMAGVQDGALTVAVSNAGGLGSLPCAMLAPDAMRTELRTIAARTDRPVNVNFFCHTPPAAAAGRERAWREALAPYYRELGVEADGAPAPRGRAPFGAEAAAVLAELRPAVVSFHFGLPPADLLDEARRSGAKIVSSATTVAEARWLEAHGVDAVIAQGLEAGGHRGMFLTDDVTTQAGTFALLPQIVNAVKVPVIAAGGIADGAGIAAAMALGASGVQIGTAYLLCQEATTSALHRAAIGSDASRHTAVTNVFTGRPARAIVNRAIAELGPMSAAAPAFPSAYDAIAPLRAESERRGRADFSPLWAGQNVTGCREMAAGDLTRRLWEDALARLQAMKLTGGHAR